MRCNMHHDDLMQRLVVNEKDLLRHIRTSIPTIDKYSIVTKTTDYTGILVSDQLVNHIRFKMFEIAKYS